MAFAPGASGASNVYEIHVDPSEPLRLQFHTGPVDPQQLGGVSLEALLAIVIHRLEGFQSGPFKCKDNDDALGTSPERLDESTSTVFTFTLEPSGEGTRLTVVETGFDRTSDPASNMADHAGGWVSELDELVAFVEGSA